MNKSIVIMILIFLFSCSNDTDREEDQILEGKGTVWLSGGLAFCATQFRMENGDTLIPNRFTSEWVKLKSGDHIKLKYQELEMRESGCNIGKDCKIIELEVIE